jgi:NADPH:quinone reductase-like Zn-dependent oxidoreductase
MKAILHHRYGSPLLLELAYIPVPDIDEEGVLVRVRAASVNALDWHRTTAHPFVVRTGEGWRRPKEPRLGVDVAGEVTAVGAKVTELRPGDAVFGTRTGAFAEFVAGDERNFAPKPANLTFEQAAALPVAGTTALQGLRDKGRLAAGERVLIAGAGGGVGHAAVQIAKALGGEVTAVSRTANLEMLRSIGADRVIDYTTEDFTTGRERYDLVMDISGTRPLRAIRKVLAPGGRVVVVGAIGHGQVAPVDRMLYAFLLQRLRGGDVIPFISQTSKPDLLVLRDLAESGRLTPVIDRTFPLEEVPNAIDYVQREQTRGKVVITVAGSGA